jgi:beta-carotene/zeaxanthin 4-ketolase
LSDASSKVLASQYHERLVLIREPFLYLSNCYRTGFYSRLRLLQLIQAYPGVAIALLILSVWATSIAIAFYFGAQAIGPAGCLLLILWFTFLYTGLFVTGHDAMHESVAPDQPRLNRTLGELALFCYGLIPYDKLYQAHSHHHQFPASHQDPDFHNGKHTHPLLWYARFMRSYWTVRQTVGIVVIYNGLYRVMGVPEANLLVFWAIPSLLSSMQLFYFGTYLVHRQKPQPWQKKGRLSHGSTHQPYADHHCAHSHYWPWLISLVTCYHFGYHHEHHALPSVPWWQLPRFKFAASGLNAGLSDELISAGAMVALGDRETDLALNHPLNYPLNHPLNHKCASKGNPLATMSRPLLKRDFTRLKT